MHARAGAGARMVRDDCPWAGGAGRTGLAMTNMVGTEGEGSVGIPQGAVVLVKRANRHAEKAELRAKIQETTHKFTALIRADIRRKWFDGWRPSPVGWVLPGPDKIRTGEEIPEDVLEMLQPAVQEYDPVVELALIAVDYRNEPNLRRLANADVAPYVRPKLSPIKEDPDDDPDDEDAPDRKMALLERLASVVDMISLQKASGQDLIEAEVVAKTEASPAAAEQPKTNGHDPHPNGYDPTAEDPDEA